MAWPVGRKSVRNTQVEKPCSVCGKLFKVPKCHAHRVSRCSRTCHGLARRTVGIEFEEAWFYLNNLGYYFSSKHGLLHRKIWHKINGPIPRGYVVHHKNGVRTDNRIENLEVMPKREHDRLSTSERHERRRREMVKQ